MEGTAPADVWLPKDKLPAYYDMTAYSGEPGTLRFEHITGGIDNLWRTVPGRVIHEWHDWVLDGYQLYSNARSRYYNTVNKLKARSEKRECFWPDLFGVNGLDWCDHLETLVLPHPRKESYLI